MSLKFLLALAILASTVLPASAQFVTGEAVVTDGDSMRIGDTRIRLYGVAAPELDRTCPRTGGGDWPCGKASRDFLADLAALGPVACEGVELDQYGRLLAECDAYDGRSINAEMIRQGMAWAFVRYAAEYLPEEREAEAARRGVWQAD